MNMKVVHFIIAAWVLLTVSAAAQIPLAEWPYAPHAGQTGSTAISMGSTEIVGWADGYQDLSYGAGVAVKWQTPALALGPATGTSFDILCLGDNGQVTMSFSYGITDGDGFDFAVFENAFDDYFLELAYVEVSSDGTNFVRFPNVSYTPLGAETVTARDVYGLAGKYRQGFGTPFDLSELADVDIFLKTGQQGMLTDEYVESFTNAYPYLDVSNIKYIRLIDVIGDGSFMSSWGAPIIDPYPTGGSAGFDLDAVGVINRSVLNGAEQVITFPSIPHQRLDFQMLQLSAVADSGLPVSYSVQSGPASITNALLYFAGTGTVEVVARQAGDATYAPASPVLRSFRIADEIQHIFVEPVPYLSATPADYLIHAYSSAGLPVHLEVQSGPAAVTVNELTHELVPAVPGDVVLRAYQPGNAAVAPAEEVLVPVHIQADDTGLLTMPEWLAGSTVAGLSSSTGQDQRGRPSMKLGYDQDLRVLMNTRIQVSEDLVHWTNAVPETVGQSVSNGVLHMEVEVPMEGSNRYFRIQYEDRLSPDL